MGYRGEHGTGGGDAEVLRNVRHCLMKFLGSIAYGNSIFCELMKVTFEVAKIIRLYLMVLVNGKENPDTGA
ncbi:hypothetical protein AGMMS49942_18490 [Spirochaetia bacterium]|nr:hypothetical protein AGMMS49942_18490 [Spirochaetia bacterium]